MKDSEFIILTGNEELRINKKDLKNWIRQMDLSDGIHIFCKSGSVTVILDKDRWEIIEYEDMKNPRNSNIHIYPKEKKS